MLKSLFLLSFIVVFTSCGKKDSIEVETQAQRIGDGTNITQNLILPLSDKVLASYDDSTKTLSPLVGGILRSVMNVAASLGAGKTKLSITQRLPEAHDIPEELTSLKIKRIFFLVDKKELTKEEKNKASNRIKEFVTGLNPFSKRDEAEENEEDINFNFLEGLALQMSVHNKTFENDTWEPTVENASLSKDEKQILAESRNVKNYKLNESVFNDYRNESFLLLSYAKPVEVKGRRPERKAKTHGSTYILATENPSEARQFLIGKDSPTKPLIKQMTVLNKTLLVEVNNDPVDESLFMGWVNSDAQKFNGISKNMKACGKNCLDFELMDLNLLPLIKQGNALKIDALIDPGKNPPTFQLKGYIEFEVKFKSAI